MKVITVLAAFVAAAAAAKDKRTFAVLRFTNKQLVKTRVDPIVNPGGVGSHVHSVFGGSGFGMSATGRDLEQSKCSTAKVKGDNSNYWVPSLYFRDPKTGKYEDVELFYANAYYLFDPTNDDVKAFPLGLNMLVGDSSARSPPPGGANSNRDPSKGPVNPVKWTCPRQKLDTPSWPTGSDGKLAGIGDPGNKGEGVGFPDVNCDGYASPLRADIHFPSCYNPAAGLTNYQSNMAFPSDSGHGKLDCPKGWIHVPHLFLEVYWNTPLFKDRWEQGMGTQPFVLSNGDATGYSLHADFLAGWDEKLLQHIIDTCDAGTGGMDKCPGLFYGTNEGDCTIESPVNEQVNGILDILPGHNPISGWAYGGGAGGSSKPHSVGESGTSTMASQTQASSMPTKGQGESSQGRPESTGQQGPSNTSTDTGKPAPTSVSAFPSNVPTSHDGLPSSDKYSAMPTESAGPCSCSPDGPTGVCKCSPSISPVQETATATRLIPEATSGPASNSSHFVNGFKYAGCVEDARNRVLSGEIRPNLGPMSNYKCIAHCKAAGYTLAGTEYGGQCYCGNEIVGSKRLDDSRCHMVCEGDPARICGGSWALTLYSKDGEISMKSTKGRRNIHHRARRHRESHH